jgi:DNA polymerase-3 subunit delta'
VNGGAEDGPELLGWEGLLEGLWNAAATERLSHALLFRGTAGIGKFAALLRLACGLLCAQGHGPPCGVCGPCKRVRSDNHLDLLVLDPTLPGPDGEEGGREVIPIAWITPRKDGSDRDRPNGPAIEEFLELRAHEGGWKVVIVREAERMNPSAQNAFLKMLEEPRPGTLLALESGFPDRLLPTVRSRLVDVHGPRLDDEDVRAILRRAGTSEAEAAKLALLGRGSPGRALERAACSANEVLELLTELVHGRVSTAEVGPALAELPGSYAGRTPLMRTRFRVRLQLDLGIEFLADLHREESLAGRDGRAADLRLRLESWLEAREDVDANLSPDAALDRALAVLEGAGAVAGTEGARSPW